VIIAYYLLIAVLVLYTTGWFTAVALAYEHTGKTGWQAYVAALIWPLVVIYVLIRSFIDWMRAFAARRHA